MKFVLLLLVFVILVSGCVQQTPQEEAVKIGVITPLTGTFARYGTFTQNAIRLALEDTKHKFMPIYEDEKNAPLESVNAARKFLYVDNIRIIVGPLDVDSFKAAKPAVFEENAVIFLTGFGDDEAFEKGKNGINLASQIYSEDNVLAYFAYNNLSARKVAIIHINSDFGLSHATNFRRYFEGLGGVITLVENVEADTTDFRTQVLKAVQTNPDAIFFEYDGETQPTGLKQIRELGINITLFGMYGSEQNRLVELAEEAAEGFYYSYPIDSEALTEKQRSFIKRYKARFGREPFVTSFFVYDGIILLDKALDRCTQKDGTCIADFFKGVKDYEGVSGEISFNDDGSIEREFIIKQIVNGTYVKVPI